MNKIYIFDPPGHGRLCSFGDGVRRFVSVRTQNKLMTGHTAGPSGSL